MSLPDNPYFVAVKKHADSMLEFGRPLVDEERCPLFAGTIDVGRQEITSGNMVPPPGIRMSDFNWCGNNLMHDIPFLETLDALTRLTGDGQYARAVEEVFAFYGEHCPDAVTGLFPWGEHAQWCFADRSALPCMFSGGVKNFLDYRYIIHDHLRFTPEWFWEAMWQHHPEAVVKFAHGLQGHIVDEETFRHNRHAPLTENNWRTADDPPKLGGDFARHSGHYIFDCLFAFKKSGDRSLLDWARRKLQYHLSNRLPNGIIRASRSQPPVEGQHDGLALSVGDAADLLGRETPEGREFGEYADDLFEMRAKEAAQRPAPVIEGEPEGDAWVSGYFRKPRQTFGWGRGSTNRQLYDRTGCEWFADAITETARWETERLPDPPARIPVRADVYQSRLDNAISAYTLTGDGRFLDGAAKFADLALAALFRNDFLMGASNMNIYRAKVSSEYHVDEWADPPSPGFYFSVSGTPQLTRTLLRLALLMEGEDDSLGVDKHSR